MYRILRTEPLPKIVEHGGTDGLPAGWIPSSLTSPFAASGDKRCDKLHASWTLKPSDQREHRKIKTCLKPICLCVIWSSAVVVHSKIHLFEFHCSRQVDGTNYE